MKNTLLFICIMCLTIVACKDKADTENQDIELTDSLSIDTVEIIDEIPIEELIDKDESKLNEAQIVIQDLLEVCAVSDFAAASKTLAYMGGDENRNYNDNFNYSDDSEKMVVDITAGLIKDWLINSESYDFITFEEMESDIGTLQVVEVMFNNKEGVGINRRFFRLKETSKGLLLVAMD